VRLQPLGHPSAFSLNYWTDAPFAEARTGPAPPRLAKERAL
jgi:hypothetical protein